MLDLVVKNKKVKKDCEFESFHQQKANTEHLAIKNNHNIPHAK